MKKLARLLACIAIVTILSCNKESQEYNPANSVITQIDVKTKSGNQDLPTISRFKELFNYNFFSTNFQPFNGDSTNAFSDFEPIWYLAQEIPVNNSQIVTVPLFTGYESDQISDIPTFQLAFSTNDECGETFELIIFAHSDNLEDVKNENKCYPSGAMTIINSCNCTSKFAVLEDGLPVYYNDIDMSEIPQYINDGSRFAFWDWFSDHILCYDFRTPWFERLGNWFRGKVKDFKDFFKLKDETGNSSENGGQGGIIITTTNGFPNYGSSQSNNTGGSGGYNSYEDIIYLFQNNFFNGEGTKVKNSLESLIGDYDMQICIEDLHKQLYNCLNEVANDPELCLTSGIMLPGDPNDPQDPIDPSNNFISFSDYSDLLSKIELENTSCLNDIISSVRTDVDLDKGD